MNILTGVLLMGSLLAVGAAAAQGLTRGPAPFEDYDTNRDGIIDRQEFDTVRARRMEQRSGQGMPMRGQANAPRFEDFDADGDGRITPEELTAGQAARRQGQRVQSPGGAMPRFEEFDTDSDGFITQAEFDAARGARIGSRAAEGRPLRNLPTAPPFASFDSDGDGRISRQEWQRGQQLHRQGGAGGAAPQAGANRPGFAAFDLNGDGVVTETEFYQARGGRMAERAEQGYPLRNAPNAPAFTDLDRDGDGRLTPEEFAARQPPAGRGRGQQP